MWYWLLDHWWVATAAPYFAFNYWTLWAFQRDEGPIDFRDKEELTGWLLVMAAGLPIVATYAVGMIVRAFGAGILEGVVETLRLEWRWRLFAARGSAALAFLLVFDVLYVSGLAATDYHPGAFERHAMQIVLAVGAYWIATKIITGRRT